MPFAAVLERILNDVKVPVDLDPSWSFLNHRCRSRSSKCTRRSLDSAGRLKLLSVKTMARNGC